MEREAQTQNCWTQTCRVVVRAAGGQAWLLTLMANSHISKSVVAGTSASRKREAHRVFELPDAALDTITRDRTVGGSTAASASRR